MPPAISSRSGRTASSPPAGADPAGDDPERRRADELGRDEGLRRREHGRQRRDETFVRVLDDVAVAAHDLGGVGVVGTDQHPGRQQRADLVQAQLVGGDHPEVGAGSPQPPEQVGVLVLADVGTRRPR